MQSYSDVEDEDQDQSLGRDKRPRKTSRRRSKGPNIKTTAYRMQDVSPLERATVDKAKVG